MRGKTEVFIKGMIVGGTMLVPGVSGGSMAMILGIYDRLIRAVSMLPRQMFGNLIFLGMFAAGGGIGMMFFSRPLLFLVENYKMPSLYFFIGAVLGGIPMIGKKAKADKFSIKDSGWIFTGAGVVLLLALAEQRGILMETGHLEIWSLVAAGAVGAVALILPGISVSYLFLAMGLYDIIIKAIRDIQFEVLLPLGIGLLLGIALTTRLLETAMRCFPRATYLIILGFVMGAVGTIFPGLPRGEQWLVCPLLAVVGYIGVRWISSKE